MPFDDGSMAKIFGQAREWTGSAVHIHWSIGDGNNRDAWVWSGAVARV